MIEIKIMEIDELVKIEPTNIEQAFSLRSMLAIKADNAEVALGTMNREPLMDNKLEFNRKHKTLHAQHKQARQRMNYLKQWISAEKRNTAKKTPDSWPRIAVALERIADALEGIEQK